MSHIGFVAVMAVKPKEGEKTGGLHNQKLLKYNKLCFKLPFVIFSNTVKSQQYVNVLVAVSMSAIE